MNRERMNTKTNRPIVPIFVMMAILSVVFSGCTPGQKTAPASSLPPTAAPASAVPIPTTIPSNPIPELTLKQGDFYFSLDGTQTLIFSRNLGGYQTPQYDQLLDLIQAGGSKLVRIQLDSMGMGYTNAGAVDLAWVSRWEQVFDRAQADGIYVLPVFTGWFDWNAGSGYSTWASNPLNAARGGPVKTPAELFQKDSATQDLWLKWMQNSRQALADAEKYSRLGDLF